MDTWIKLYRKFTEWEWFNIPEMVHLFIYLLLKANNEPGTWRGVSIKRGQVLTGLNSLNEATGISVRKIRTCLDRLHKTGEIDIQTTNKYSIITINKYDSYQIQRQTNDTQNGKRPTSNRQAIDNKQEYKEEKNNKENNKAIESPDFIDQLLDCFVQEHGNYEIIARGKERKAIAIILKTYKEKYPAATTDETIAGLRLYFKQCVNINDSWLKNNMSPTIIVNKFNEINKILKNGTHRQGNGASDEAIAAIIAKKFGTDSPDKRN